MIPVFWKFSSCDFGPELQVQGPFIFPLPLKEFLSFIQLPSLGLSLSCFLFYFLSSLHRIINNNWFIRFCQVVIHNRGWLLADGDWTRMNWSRSSYICWLPAPNWSRRVPTWHPHHFLRQTWVSNPSPATKETVRLSSSGWILLILFPLSQPNLWQNLCCRKNLTFLMAYFFPERDIWGL